jgi:hypothetical protein
MIGAQEVEKKCIIKLNQRMQELEKLDFKQSIAITEGLEKEVEDGIEKMIEDNTYRRRNDTLK